jgi:hypothetical protein
MKKNISNNPPKLKRNIFLTILLVLIILANTFVGFIFFLNIAGIADGAYATMSKGMVIFSFLVCIANIICGYAIWYWRKWGLIGYGVIVIMAFLVTGIVTKDFSNFYSLVGLTLLSILLYPFWKFMK